MPIFNNSIKPYNMTICEVLMGPQGCESTKGMKIYLSGVSYRSALDKVNKNEGRKHALKYALESSTLYSNERNFRKAAWEAYLNRKPVKAVAYFTKAS